MKYRPFYLSNNKDVVVAEIARPSGSPCDAYLVIDVRSADEAEIVTATDIVRRCFRDVSFYLGESLGSDILKKVEEKINAVDDRQVRRFVKQANNWFNRMSKKSVREDEMLVKKLVSESEDDDGTPYWHEISDFLTIPDFENMEPFTIGEAKNLGEGWYIINNPKGFNTYIVIMDINDHDGFKFGSILMIDNYFRWNPYEPLYFGDDYKSDEGLEKAKEYLRKCPKEILKEKTLDMERTLWVWTHTAADKEGEKSDRKIFFESEKQMMKYIEEEKAKGNYDLFI